MPGSRRPCAIVGAGRIGRFYGEVLRESEHFKLVAHCDPRPEAAAPMQPGCRAYSDLNALLQREQIAAALICAPPDRHLELATRCIERGVHVLCEKPLATDAEKCSAIERAVRGGTAQLAVSSKFRYVPAVGEARRLLRDGALGSLRRLVIDFSASLDVRGDWRADVTRGGGVLLDNGPHAADLSQFLLGELGLIESCCLVKASAGAVDHDARLDLRYASGAIGKVRLSWRAEPSPTYLTIEGSAGSLEIGWRESVFRKGATARLIANGGYSKHQAFARMLDDFAAFIDGEPCALSDLSSACRHVAWVQSAYRAARTNYVEGGDFELLGRETRPASRN